MLDVDHPQGGDVSDAFADYSPARNAAAVDAMLSELGVALPTGARQLLIGLPPADRCRTRGGTAVVAATAD